MDAFLKDTSPTSYEKLVDRLLASPQYGERWGRHWLDVAGYADSEGASPQDPERTNAWKYRDYVIRSLNADKPFDRFIKEQLAGDELVKPPYAELKADELDALIATGFLRMAPDGSGAPIRSSQEMPCSLIRSRSLAFLGLTVGWCHNHRYDPIPRGLHRPAAFEPLRLTNWKLPAPAAGFTLHRGRQEEGGRGGRSRADRQGTG